MRPKKHKTTGSNDLFRARLDQIINLKHELVQLAGKVDLDRKTHSLSRCYALCGGGLRANSTRDLRGSDKGYSILC